VYFEDLQFEDNLLFDGYKKGSIKAGIIIVLYAADGII